MKLRSMFQWCDFGHHVTSSLLTRNVNFSLLGSRLNNLGTALENIVPLVAKWKSF